MTLKHHIRELEKGHLLSRFAILVVVSAILFTAGTFCLRTISTGLKLAFISTSISSMTETAHGSPNGWSDELSKYYEEEIDKRNALINSDDEFVSFIARNNNFVRFATLIALSVLVYFLTSLFFKLTFCEYVTFKKYLRYKKRQKARQS